MQAICSTGLNLFRLLIAYLKPVLPTMAQNVERFLAIDPLRFDSVDTLLLVLPSTLIALTAKTTKEYVLALKLTSFSALAFAVASVPLAWAMGWLSMTWLYVVGFILGTISTTAGSA